MDGDDIRKVEGGGRSHPPARQRLANDNIAGGYSRRSGRRADHLPTGDYTVGHLANTGKNYYTTEPTVGFIYLGTKNGREGSIFAGIDFNTQNPATQYTTGTEFHLV